MSKAEDDKAQKAKEELLSRIRDRFDTAFKAWDPLYKIGDKCMAALAGDPWDPADKQARDDAGRPAVTFDELGQYINTAVNEVRANPRAVKFSPTGDGANDETARVYGDLMRETEYRSNAQIAYTTAFENAIQRGYGFVRIRSAYEHVRSRMQHLIIEPIANPSAVYPDPDAMKPDGSDWRYLFFVESYTRDEFKRAFPDAEFKDYNKEQIATAGATAWQSEERVQVAEYWEVQTKMVDLVAVQLKDGRVVEFLEGVDEVPKGVGAKRDGRYPREIERVSKEHKTVCQYFTNGLEVLADESGEEKHEWDGEYIPFAACYGKIVWLNRGSGPERKLIGMVNAALEPFMAYCFAASCELEAIGTITKNPFFAYAGTLDPKQKNEIVRSLHEPVAVLESKPFLDEQHGVLLPLPQRNPLSVDLSSYALVKEGARRAIQAAMGGFALQTSQQRQNQKLSGKAVEKYEEASSKGSFHFVDHFNDMIRFVGVQCEDLFDKKYDTDRVVTVIDAMKKARKVRVNPAGDQQMIEQGVDVLESMKGRHAVTVDVGPELDSEREQADRVIEGITQSPILPLIEPNKRDEIFAASIRASNAGPMVDAIADIISPPKSKDGQPDPAQLQALLQQANEQIIPSLQAQIQQLQGERQAKVVETQGRLAVAAQTDQTKLQIASMQTEQKRDDTDIQSDTDLAIAKLQAQIDVMKMQLQERIEGAKLEHATAMAERGHEEGAAESAAGRRHEALEGERGRQATAAEGDKARAATAREGDENRSAAERAAAQKGDAE